MQDPTVQTLETLGMLYETAFGFDRWPRALDAIAQLIGGNGAVLFVDDAARPDLQIAAMSTRYKPEHAAQYVRSLTAQDELQWVRVLDTLPPRTLRMDTEVWPDRAAYDAMASVRFMRTMNLYHRVGLRLCAHAGWKDALTVLFDDRRGTIEPVEAQRLALLVPHMARAIEMQRPFKLLRARFNAVLSALDRLGIGVLILSEGGELVVTNAEAERVLDAADGLIRASNGHLAATDAAMATRLAKLFKQTARVARLEQQGQRIALQVRRRSRAAAYILEVAPFRDDGVEMGSAFVGVLLLVIDPDRRDLVAVEGLAQSYALTATETLVCQMIAQGMKLRDIADSRNVSLETIKSQSRAIYTKTQTRNRHELVQRAQSIVPPLLDGAGKRVN